jgi:hypothetical protein
MSDTVCLQNVSSDICLISSKKINCLKTMSDTVCLQNVSSDICLISSEKNKLSEDNVLNCLPLHLNLQTIVFK